MVAAQIGSISTLSSCLRLNAMLEPTAIQKAPFALTGFLRHGAALTVGMDGGAWVPVEKVLTECLYLTPSPRGAHNPYAKLWRAFHSD
jgi:hypothetical protein